MKLFKGTLSFLIATMMIGSTALSANAATVQPQSSSVSYYDKYVENSYSYVYGTPVEVTPEIIGPGSINYGQNRMVSSTFSASVTSGDINNIIGKLGAGYSKSATTNESFGMTFTIAKGEKKRIYFKPRLRNTVGKIESWRQRESELNPTLISSKNVSGKVVTKVGKFADGTYYAGN